MNNNSIKGQGIISASKDADLKKAGFQTAAEIISNNLKKLESVYIPKKFF